MNITNVFFLCGNKKQPHHMKPFKKIYKRRIEMGLSQEAVGKKLGISQAAYQRYETKEVDMRISTAKRIARVLKMEIVDLL